MIDGNQHPAELFDLRGKAVIATGGAAGIGKVYSEQLCAAGARAAIADIVVDGGKALH